MFRIHRSERADALVDALVEVVARPVGDPFDPEVVAVPTRGVERWLTHRLAAVLGAGPDGGDGVCANVVFPFPGRLVGDVLAEATGVDRHEDPWRPERLVWPLLDTIDDHLDEPWLALLAGHLGHHDTADGPGDPRRGDRRFATARHLADLFDGYGTYRPSRIESWLDHDGNRDCPRGPADAQWQPRLWRALRERVASPSPPERIARACRGLRDGAVEVSVPARISLFGLTRLPATYLEVLRALATRRDVHLFALHPSLVLWERLADAEVPTLPLRRRDDPTGSLPQNPLLRTWATDTREMQLVLAAAADAEQAHRPVDTRDPATLLERVQADIRADAAPPGRPTAGGLDGRIVLAPADRSIEVHACHGRARQVEIARDAIAHALADDPSLEPRDVIVLCPDIDEFAPLLHATFGAVAPLDDDPGIRGAAAARGLPDLPYRLADRSLRQTNPLLSALDALLTIVEGRITAPELLTFLGRDPVRRRFALDDDDLDQLATWTADSQIRWGLDGVRRGRYWLDGVDANTWRVGLDRILLGAAMTTDGSRLLGDRLPLDDVESGDVDLAGRFAEFVDRVDTVVTRTEGTHDIATWVETLGDAVDLLMTTRSIDAWQRVQVDSVLREVLDEATTGSEVAAGRLSLPEVRALLDHRLRGVPTRADFRTGAITMCTLVPMRAVPHRVVCILGLDDGVFPRTGRPDGDDLRRAEPFVGDHDRRIEDRQLLLDAVLAATDRLIITTTGADERTNEPRPPAVPLSELLEVIDRTARLADGRDATAQVRHRHPLQPFDPVAHDATTGRPWAFDRVSLGGARALSGPRHAPAPFLTEPLAPLPVPDVVGLDELVRFFQHPVREFLRQRLGVNVWDGDDDLDDAIPVELDALERWKVGQRLVERLCAGDSLDAAVDAELAVGALPPEAMGRDTVSSIADTATRIHAVALAAGIGGATSSREVDVDVVLDGRPVAVVGTVPGLAGDALGQVSFSSIGARHRLAAWIRLLALTAAHPQTPWQAHTVGRHKAGGRLVEIAPLGETTEIRRARAVELLSDLVSIRARGLREPLPLPCKTAASWASARHARREPSRSASRDWASGHRFPGEDADRSHRIVYGGTRRLDELLTIPPADDETGTGWADDEPSRLGRLARRVWDPVLALERWR